MRFYPDIPSQRAATIVSDLVVLSLLVLFAWLGFKVHDTVDRLAVLGEGVRDAGESVQGGFQTAADAVEEAPLVGDDVAGGLREAGEGTGGNAAEIGREGEERVHRTADLLGFLTFLIPSVLLLFQAAPPRIALVRRLTAASRVLRDGDGERERLLAMRAAFSLPYGQLLHYTDDPFGDLAAGRYDSLVSAAFEEAGLRPR
ncbi:MAG: hypothetical protein M3265_04525 [Actinomycetota bacterium]|jgi:hypothetical protein|nr:hypothetical protein [Actinomycetota bacterium]